MRTARFKGGLVWFGVTRLTGWYVSPISPSHIPSLCRSDCTVENAIVQKVVFKDDQHRTFPVFRYAERNDDWCTHVTDVITTSWYDIVSVKCTKKL